MSEEESKLKICDVCGVKSARVVKRPQVLGRGAGMILVDNVPVIACKNCGASYMTSETIHKLDDLRSKQKADFTQRKIAIGEFV